MDEEPRARRWFLAVWAIVTVVKVAIAARLPLFVDEAFYWQEGQHLAAAYSDLPGLTAWLIRLGTDIGERAIIGRIRAKVPPAPDWVTIGIGDDAAVLRPPGMQKLLIITLITPD